MMNLILKALTSKKDLVQVSEFIRTNIIIFPSLEENPDIIQTEDNIFERPLFISKSSKDSENIILYTSEAASESLGSMVEIANAIKYEDHKSKPEFIKEKLKNNKEKLKTLKNVVTAILNFFSLLVEWWQSCIKENKIEKVTCLLSKFSILKKKILKGLSYFTVLKGKVENLPEIHEVKLERVFNEISSKEDAPILKSEKSVESLYAACSFCDKEYEKEHGLKLDCNHFIDRSCLIEYASL